MKKQVITLNIGDFAPKVTALTLPTIARWAEKIGAECKCITKPVFNRPSVTYEKFQLWDMIPGYDWTIFVDADTLVHPDAPDWSEMVTKDTVVFHGLDMALNRFRANDYTRRSRKLNGACTWLVMCSDWCRDLWHPLDDVTWEECMAAISPISHELRSGACPREHLIDDYLLTRNLARYNLNVTTILDLCKQISHPSDYFFHLYACSYEDKISKITEKAKQWGLL